MHMHTLKIAIIEPDEPFTFERFASELIGPSRPAAAAAAPRAAGAVPAQPPVVDRRPARSTSRRHVFRARAAGARWHGRARGSSSARSPSTPLDRSRAAVGAARVRGARGRPGRRRRQDAPRARRRRRGERPARQRDRPAVRQGSDARWAPLEDPTPTPSRGSQVVLALRDAIRQTFTLPGLAVADAAARWSRVVRHRRASDGRRAPPGPRRAAHVVQRRR